MTRKMIKVAVSKCPTKLEDIIKTVNLIPENTKLPNFTEIFNRIEQEFIQENGLTRDVINYKEINIELLLKLLDKVERESFSTLPVEFQEYIMKNAFSKSRRYINNEEKFKETAIKFIENSYSEFVDLRKDLYQIVNYFDVLRKENGFSIGVYGYYDKNGNLISLPRFELAIQLTESTRIEIVPTGLAEAINGIDGTRLRSCEVCNKIFWAKRKDAETCSKPCLNSYRQRRFYQRNKEELQKARRERYQHSKRQKLIKEGKESANL